MAVTGRVGHLVPAGPAVWPTAARSSSERWGSRRLDRLAVFQLPAEGPQRVVEP